MGTSSVTSIIAVGAICSTLCETLIIEGVLTKLPAYMNWKSINSEQSYYTIAKTSHIQQRIIGKSERLWPKSYPSSTVQPTQHTLYLLGHVVALASIMLQHNPNICLHFST
jgi:hypothetical protein